MISLGIDSSTKATGFVVLKTEGKTRTPEILHRSTSSYPKLKVGYYRNSAIASDLCDLLNKYHPQKVAIEGYGLNFKHTSSVVPLVELGGLLRYFLIQLGYSFLDPRPGQHKQFVTGSGNAKKPEIMKFVKSRWGFDTKSNDEADAYGLAMMGLAHGGQILGLSVTELEIIASIKQSTSHE